MLPVRLPSQNDLRSLIEQRSSASVSVYVPTSPLPRESDAGRLRLRNLLKDAEAQLDAAGISRNDIRGALQPIESLEAEPDFWRHQARSLAIFAADGTVSTFTLPTTVRERIAVGDRFDIGPLLRAVTFPQGAYVIAVAEKAVHLYRLVVDGAPEEIPLPDLPSDLHSVFEHAENSGQADPPRAEGATGPRIEQQRFCRIVQDAVLARIDGNTVPLILAASRDLEPAYRAINTYPTLLERGIHQHPDSLEPSEIAILARSILDEHHAGELAAWRERFGTLQSGRRATCNLAEVASAASAGAVDELIFDMDDSSEGMIDADGRVHEAVDASAAAYGIVDEIAARVLRSGGTVRAVRSGDLIDESPVAATLRYSL